MKGSTAELEEIPLRSPYDRNSLISVVSYHLETFLVVNPRIHSLFLLVKSTAPRLLVCLDVYTDFLVALSLYHNNESLLFMISCILIATPFLIVWNSSLRIIQRWLSNHTGTRHLLLNCFLFFYIVPPIGSLIMFFIELGWIFLDLIDCLRSICLGTSEVLIESSDSELMALKEYRRGIEMFGESIPQTIVQCYIMFFSNTIEVDEFELSLSIFASVLNLIYSLVA